MMSKEKGEKKELYNLESPAYLPLQKIFSDLVCERPPMVIFMGGHITFDSENIL